jgi:hypothetical protein
MSVFYHITAQCFSPFFKYGGTIKTSTACSSPDDDDDDDDDDYEYSDDDGQTLWIRTK